VVYKPLKTKLIEYAESIGATTILGYEMLVAQAEASFKLWTGVEAPKNAMKNAAVKTLRSDRS